MLGAFSSTKDKCDALSPVEPLRRCTKPEELRVDDLLTDHSASRVQHPDFGRMGFLEEEYWARHVEIPVQATVAIPLRKDHGAVSAMAVTSGTTPNLTFIAAGTTKGVILVWMMKDCSTEKDMNKGKKSSAVLLRSKTTEGISQKDQAPITQMYFSRDGASQLLTLDAHGVVMLWSLVTPSLAAGDVPAKTLGDFRVRPLLPRLKISAMDLARWPRDSIRGRVRSTILTPARTFTLYWDYPARVGRFARLSTRAGVSG